MCIDTPAGTGKGVTKLGLSAKKDEDFGEWYSQVVVESEMISYYDVSGAQNSSFLKAMSLADVPNSILSMFLSYVPFLFLNLFVGCYILRPGSFAIWDEIKTWLDAQIKSIGVQNAYFPLFITEDVLMTEKDHVEGFAPEVAWVTKSGSNDMDRPIAIRPTSETVMYPYFANWIQSHRDLPLRLNQWTNVVRWEFKHPTPFIRSREFLWQEGHTAFATKQEADDEVHTVLDLYRQVYEDLLAVPVIKGIKSAKEKFAGALYTTTVEAFIPQNGRGIQGATSHCLGQNFSKMFKIEYETDTPEKIRANPWQNSWGMTTRTIGVMIMTHGDDKGIVLPPRVAQVQAVVIPIPNSKLAPEEAAALQNKASEIASSLKTAGVKIKMDDRVNYTPGWKYNFWELRGVPLRIELGPKDMEKQTVFVARRDTFMKESISWADIPTRIPALLAEIQRDMLSSARARFNACIERAGDWDEFMASLDRKHMVLTPWADEVEIEEEVKKRSATGIAGSAKTLCIPLEQPELPEGTLCFVSGKPAKNWALWGRSY